ncbi:MAG: molybdopterin-binding protein [Marmoricola sp.]|nr:molybdopterin-binding protein [Marmoricola sp.]
MLSPRSFSSAVRGPWLTARLGTWVGVCFGLAFLTGLVSHWYYLPDPPFLPPTRPVWGYRFTQGLHVLSGTAAVPLLLVKLWSVYPRLFVRPTLAPARLALIHLVERVSILVLVAAALFQLVAGLANAAQWYPWSFSFRPAHYAGAWIAVGALVVHIAVKLPVIRSAYAGEESGPEPEVPAAPVDHAGRRTVLRAAFLASGVAVLSVAGGTVPWLRRVSLLAVRTGEGPQGLPVNRSAQAAGVTETARDAGWRLTVSHAGRERVLTLADLQGMRQRTHSLPIACVEGWSASATWTGVRLRDLLDLVGAPAGADVRIRSLQTRGAFGATLLPGSFARDDLTLLALRVNGEQLDLDHGFPCRLIAPNRPGVLQTKWVTRIEVA